MGRLTVSLFVIFAAITIADSIKCLDCMGFDDDCKMATLEANLTKYTKTCGSSYDRCKKYWSKKKDSTIIFRGCANEEMCALVEQECDKTGEDVKCGVYCCTDEVCNAGARAFFSLFSLVLFSIFGFVLTKL